MKKMINKNLFILVGGLFVLLLELIVVYTKLTSLNVLTYIFSVGLFPALILFIIFFVYSYKANVDKKESYILAITFAIIFAIIMLGFCGAVITPELVDKIVANSITSNTTQASMTTASTGDNVQSVLIFIASSGLGALLGNKLKLKKITTDKHVNTISIKDEYDD